jgi:hypothetical protein
MTLPKTPTIVERGLIYDATKRPADRRVAFFTCLYRLPSSGVWLSVFQVGTAKHSPDSTFQLCRSVDQGRTWSVLTFAFETQVSGVRGSLSGPALFETTPGRLLLFATWFDRREPARPLFDPVTQGILPAKQLMAESSDGGTTWSGWLILPTPGLAGCAATGPIVSWPDGALAFTFESFKQFDDPRPGHHTAWLMVSRDGGRSFGPALMVACDPQHQVYYWDQRLCPTRNPGEFIALFWTHDLLQKRDLSVHLGRGRLTGNTLESEPIRATPMRGQISAPLCLPDGRWLAFVVDRGDPCTLTLWQSRDEGLTWPESDRLVVYTHEERADVTRGGERIEFNQYWEEMGKWSFGHPALAPYADNEVLCAFYAGTPQCMSIHWARVRL